MKEEDFDVKEHMCQHATFRSCRWGNCPSEVGETECDGIWSGRGLGTYKCLCKDSVGLSELESGCVWTAGGPLLRCRCGKVPEEVNAECFTREFGTVGP